MTITATSTAAPSTTDTRLSSAWPWSGVGVALAAYPLLRPYADETTLAGLAAMASGRWLMAHLLGMVAFALLPLALARLRVLQPTSRALTVAAPLSAVAAALLLPYYGAESFGLHAVGQQAVATGDLSLLAVVDGIRYQPLAISLFGLGLVAVGLSGLLTAVALWSRGGAVRVAALAVGLGLATYLPQFFGTPGLRMGHGLVLGIACCALAVLLPQQAGASRGLRGPR